MGSSLFDRIIWPAHTFFSPVLLIQEEWCRRPGRWTLGRESDVIHPLGGRTNSFLDDPFFPTNPSPIDWQFENESRSSTKKKYNHFYGLASFPICRWCWRLLSNVTRLTTTSFLFLLSLVFRNCIESACGHFFPTSNPEKYVAGNESVSNSIILL